MDREHEVMAERRMAYTDFLDSVNLVFTAVIRGDKKLVTDRQLEMHAVASRFICYASPSTVPSARAFIEAVQNYRKEKLHGDADNQAVEDARSKAAEARANAIAAIRTDLFGGNPEQVKKEIQPFFPGVNEQ